MQGVGARDGERIIEWGGASDDYARHRPRYPESMFRRLAALGVGIYSDLSAVAEAWQLDTTFAPQMPADQIEAHVGRWHTAIAKA